MKFKNDVFRSNYFITRCFLIVNMYRCALNDQHARMLFFLKVWMLKNYCCYLFYSLVEIFFFASRMLDYEISCVCVCRVIPMSKKLICELVTAQVILKIPGRSHVWSIYLHNTFLYIHAYICVPLLNDLYMYYIIIMRTYIFYVM